MSNVIGPISLDHWKFMRHLRVNIRERKENPNSFIYKLCPKEEEHWYKETINEYVQQRSFH